MKVKFFAQLKTVTGCQETDIPAPGSVCVDALWQHLEALWPGIQRHRKTTRLAKNCQFAPKDALFAEGDEVALIPPVSGG